MIKEIRMPVVNVRKLLMKFFGEQVKQLLTTKLLTVEQKKLLLLKTINEGNYNKFNRYLDHVYALKISGVAQDEKLSVMRTLKQLNVVFFNHQYHMIDFDLEPGDVTSNLRNGIDMLNNLLDESLPLELIRKNLTDIITDSIIALNLRLNIAAATGKDDFLQAMVKQDVSKQGKPQKYNIDDSCLPSDVELSWRDSWQQRINCNNTSVLASELIREEYFIVELMEGDFYHKILTTIGLDINSGYDYLSNFSSESLQSMLSRKVIVENPMVNKTTGTITDGNGNRYQGELVNGRPNGTGNIYYSNGDHYQGTVHDGKPDGFGTYTKSSGIVYVGGFEHGTRHGKGVIKTIQQESTVTYERGKIVTSEHLRDSERDKPYIAKLNKK